MWLWDTFEIWPEQRQNCGEIMRAFNLKEFTKNIPNSKNFPFYEGWERPLELSTELHSIENYKNRSADSETEGSSKFDTPN